MDLVPRDAAEFVVGNVIRVMCSIMLRGIQPPWCRKRQRRAGDQVIPKHDGQPIEICLLLLDGGESDLHDRVGSGPAGPLYDRAGSEAAARTVKLIEFRPYGKPPLTGVAQGTEGIPQSVPGTSPAASTARGSRPPGTVRKPAGSDPSHRRSPNRTARRTVARSLVHASNRGCETNPPDRCHAGGGMRHNFRAPSRGVPR